MHWRAQGGACGRRAEPRAAAVQASRGILPPVPLSCPLHPPVLPSPSPRPAPSNSLSCPLHPPVLPLFPCPSGDEIALVPYIDLCNHRQHCDTPWG